MGCRMDMHMSPSNEFDRVCSKNSLQINFFQTASEKFCIEHM